MTTTSTNLARQIRNLLRGHTAGLATFLIISVGVSVLAHGPRFLAPVNLQSMAMQIPELALLALAMMITLLKGGLNLSIIATANACTLLVAWVAISLVQGGMTEGPAVVLSLLAGLAAAIVIGSMIGFLIGYVEISPIIATLGAMTFLKGLSLGLSKGGVLSGLPEGIISIGQGNIYGLPVSVILLAASASLLAFVLARTTFGRSLYMIGSNVVATRYSGVNTRRMVAGAYVASSILAYLAGLVMLGRFNSANASYGESYLLIAILVAVMGGVHPEGGFGKVSGLLIAVVALQVISSALNQASVSPYLTTAIWGLLLLAIAGVAAVRPQRR